MMLVMVVVKVTCFVICKCDWIPKGKNSLYSTFFVEYHCFLISWCFFVLWYKQKCFHLYLSLVFGTVRGGEVFRSAGYLLMLSSLQWASVQWYQDALAGWLTAPVLAMESPCPAFSLWLEKQLECVWCGRTGFINTALVVCFP